MRTTTGLVLILLAGLLAACAYDTANGPIRTEGSIEMGEAQLRIEHYWAGALRRAVIDGDVENGSVMAGQSVGMVTREEPAAAIVAELMADCEAALAR